MDSSVLITGCNGYIGADLSRCFKFHGWNVFGIDPAPLPENQREYFAEFQQSTILESDRKVHGLHAIVHLAGASKVADDLPDSHYQEQNVDTTKHLREQYPDVPLYMASTMAMYNENKQIEHKHVYSKTKHEAEAYADVVFRIGTTCGANHQGKFDYVIDLMLDSAIKQRKIVVAQGAKMRPLAGLTYVCMMIHRNALNGAFARRARSENAKVIQHLYEACDSIENIATTVHRVLYALPQTKYDAGKIEFIRQNDLSGIAKQAPTISCVPPDFYANQVYTTRLFRLIAECLERYETFVLKEDDS